jgi:colanic acid/amylovoran biosynthesis glycosyltransferase
MRKIINKEIEIVIIGNAFTSGKSLPTQGQILFCHLSAIFSKLKIVSTKENLLARSIDTLLSGIFIKPGSIFVFQIYGTRSLYVQFLLAIIAYFKGCKIVSTIHGGSVPVFFRNLWLRGLMLNYVFNKSQIITVPSSYIKLSLPEFDNKIKVINNYLSSDFFTKNKESADEKIIKIIWVRAYHEIYNPLKALEVINKIKSKGLNVQLIMAGPDFGLLNKTKSLSEDLGLNGNIDFYERLTISEIDDLCFDITCYLCTNIIDNAPVTFLEMMARDIPIVTTNVGGIPYMVKNNETALVSEDNSADDLANIIIFLFNNPILRNSLIENGHLKLKDFQPQCITSQWVKVVESLS